MKKELTIYCIKRGKNPKALLTITDNNIPFSVVGYHCDILESVKFIKVELLPTIKDICKDTGKNAILNCNHSDHDIASFARTLMGHKVIWKNYSFKAWNNFILGLEEFSGVEDFNIEIDHPIDLSDETIKNIVDRGLSSRQERLDAIIKFTKRKRLGKRKRKTK